MTAQINKFEIPVKPSLSIRLKWNVINQHLKSIFQNFIEALYQEKVPN